MDKKQSLNFYKFLCQKIGSEVVVKTRRIHSIISDIGAAEQKRITSGSNGEGLNFKSSDIDYMFLDRSFKVYESERNVVPQDLSIPFIMDTEDTQPCFTRLRLFDDKFYRIINVLKTLTVQNIIFDWQSFVIPPELQLDVTWNGNGVVSYAPVPFAYFLKFLCHYHLHEESLCKHWLRKLMTSVRRCKWGIRLFSTLHSKIFAGIAYQMLGEVDKARFMFVEASISDFNVSSARYRLSNF
ncbi:unnamed protein product [Mytilus edulis]|uniref:Uncharacterized protein n=1 Tax=Mytilus edulis TaxID=6550 RepID=A0A8S3UKK2_MYTED|nr:unnamed protein product [Mytilus edulis]